MRTRKQRKRLINWRTFHRVLGAIGLLLMISSFVIADLSYLPNAKPYQVLIRISPLIFGFGFILVSMLQISDINRNINKERALLYRKKVSRYFFEFAKLLTDRKFAEAELYFDTFLNYDNYFEGFFKDKSHYVLGLITGCKFNSHDDEIEKLNILNYLSE